MWTRRARIGDIFSRFSEREKERQIKKVLRRLRRKSEVGPFFLAAWLFLICADRVRELADGIREIDCPEP
jgi:hypothetical protein